MDVLVIIIGDELPSDRVMNSLSDDRLTLEIVHASTARAINQLVQHAPPCDMIIFSSPYTLWDKDALHGLCHALSDEVAAAIPTIQEWQLGRRRPTLGDMMLMRLVPAGFLGFSKVQKRLNSYLNPDIIQHPSFAACAVKRDIFERAGSMDEAFETLLMDADLGMRLTALTHIKTISQAKVSFQPSAAWEKTYVIDEAPFGKMLKALITFSDKWGVHWW